MLAQARDAFGLAVITEAMKKLASSISADERADIEATLARAAGKHDAAFVKELGTHLDDLFNPDGHFDEIPLRLVPSAVSPGWVKGK